MRKCRYCNQYIDDNATKCQHCLSFQNEIDTGTKGLDAANLVIGFIGVIAVVFTITLGVLGYFGYQSFGKLITRTNKISDDATKLIKMHTEELKKSQEALKETKTSLNDLYLKQNFERFMVFLDKLVLDDIDRTKPLMREIEQLAEDAVKIDPVSEKLKDTKNKMMLIKDSIILYKGEKFNETVEMAVEIKDDNIFKHRILLCAYAKIHGKKIEIGEKDADIYFDKVFWHSKKYDELSQCVNKKTVIGNNNRALVLMARGKEGDLDKAISILNNSIKLYPLLPILHYNYAYANYLDDKDEVAIHALQMANELGYFDTEKQKDLLEDTFPGLKNSDDEKIKESFNGLLKAMKI